MVELVRYGEVSADELDSWSLTTDPYNEIELASERLAEALAFRAAAREK